jgi:hypothetical protein
VVDETPGAGSPREITHLLAVLDAWLSAYQSFHAQYVDEGLDGPAQVQVQVLARAEVDAHSAGVPTSLMSSAIWRQRTAMAIVGALSPSEADYEQRRVDPAHPGVCLVALCQAAAMILDDWREASGDRAGAIEYGGRPPLRHHRPDWIENVHYPS